KIVPQFFLGSLDNNARSASSIEDIGPPLTPRSLLIRAFKISGTWIFLWWLPLLLAGIFLGTQHTIFREGLFFSKAALVTFGGAFNCHRRGRGRNFDSRRLVRSSRHLSAWRKHRLVCNRGLRNRVRWDASLEMEHRPCHSRQRTAWAHLHA